MTEDDKIPPAGLHPRLVRKLLDNLENNDNFRAAFSESPEKALRSIGYTDPWGCMQLRDGQKLASPEQIKTQRNKLEDASVGIQKMSCSLDSQEIEKL